MVRFRSLSSPFTSCIVEARDSEGLIGQDVLKRLDLLAECGTGTMAPANPGRYPDAPMLTLRSVGES